MNIHDSVASTIGNTPLIKLKRASEETGCTILGKAEFMNPSESVKDRAALSIIQDAVRRKAIGPGGIIVEGTAGNTGIGLAMVAGSMGFRTVIVIPETQTEEKKDALRMLGAELVQVPAKPYRNPNNFVRYSGRLAERLNAEHPEGAIWANQFDNLANRQAHIDTTGPEIWEQTGGKIDAFSCAVGSGGTLTGTAQYLRGKNPDIKIALTDPEGAALFRYFRDGELKSEGSSLMEGIGQARITANLEGFKPDLAFEIPDADALKIIFGLVHEEGMCLGGSSGINIAGAVKLARELGPGHTLVTVLCDYGSRYLSKLYNPGFLREKGLPAPEWMDPANANALPDVFEEFEEQ